jgi:hypothetical protein
MRIRPNFLLGLIILFVIIPTLLSFLLPASVGGKPTTRDLAGFACRNFVRYAKSVSTNGKFSSDFSKLPTNGLWRVGVEPHSSTVLTKGVAIEVARIYPELYGSSRAIFNTNQSFWTKTNFAFSPSSHEIVIVCKQQFYFPRSRNSFGCAYGWRRAAFVVGYSDETTGLISQQDFDSLDLGSFVPLSSLGVEGFHVRFINEMSKP